jgi:hypothetical protein
LVSEIPTTGHRPVLFTEFLVSEIRTATHLTRAIHTAASSRATSARIVARLQRPNLSCSRPPAHTRFSLARDARSWFATQAAAERDVRPQWWAGRLTTVETVGEISLVLFAVEIS